MNDRLLSLLGLCKRAGRLSQGADPCIESIVKKKARLVIFASDISENSKKRVLEYANKYKVKTVAFGRTKNEIGIALGRLCAVAAVEDEGFAKKLTALAENE